MTCSGAIQHPIDARVVAIDPIQRGHIVRFEVIASSRVDIQSAWARVIPTPGVQVIGPAHVHLEPRPNAPGEKSATFRVVVPQAGHRQLVQFRVEGEGPSGLVTRGTAFNLLPDGPSEILRPATAGSGEGLLETSATRIGR
jgi:hypothetical protein